MKKSLITRFQMPLPELEEYYRMQRAENYKNHVPIRGIRWRKRFNWIMKLMLRMNGVCIGHRITVIGNEYPVADGQPTIYACSHVGRYDIETLFLSAPEQGWLFMGDPGPVYKSVDGFLLWLNGVIFSDTAYRSDCHVGLETCIQTLKSGGSVFIYPEGAWNITENLPVMKLYDGCAEMAIRSGCGIVPVAIEKQGRHYEVNIGMKIDSSGYRLEDRKSLTEVLRDTLCTLKWQIYETHGVTGREKLQGDVSRRFINDIMSETENGYTLEEIERTRYHDKTVTEPEEAYAFMEKLIPSRENAFLLREAYKRGNLNAD